MCLDDDNSITIVYLEFVNMSQISLVKTILSFLRIHVKKEIILSPFTLKLYTYFIIFYKKNAQI